VLVAVQAEAITEQVLLVEMAAEEQEQETQLLVLLEQLTQVVAVEAEAQLQV
jgi:hypothetical protein